MAEDFMQENITGSDDVKLSIGRRAALFVLLFLLSGCGGQAPKFYSATPTPTSDPSLFLFTLPPAWSATSTRTSMIPSPTTTDTYTHKATNIITNTPSPTVIPTTRPTPTRGLPPTATISPKETCPPPTHATADIQFSKEPRDYGPQILEYIRANGNAAGLQIRLEQLGIQGKKLVDYQTHETVDYFFNDKVQIYSGDMTGDLSKETIIGLMQYKGNDMFGWPSIYTMVVFIVGCQNDQYQFLYEAGTDMADPNWSEVVAIRDLNADGIRELVYSYGTIMSAHADVPIYSIVLEWNGKNFRNLLCLPNGDCGYNATGYSLNAPLEFQDIDGNGTTELLFPENGMPLYCGYGPWRIPKDIYMWDGEYYRFMWTDPGVPEYRFQAAFDGDYYAAIGLYDKSEKMYLRAINDSALKAFSYKDSNYCSNPGESDPNEPQWIMAYARFRLLELYVNLQRMNDAENEWYYLAHNYQSTTPGYPFSSLANTFWKAFQADNNIGNACVAVKNTAGQYDKDRFGLMNYGYLNPGPTLDTICPFTATSSR
jgi:hypothetical protein